MNRISVLNCLLKIAKESILTVRQIQKIIDDNSEIQLSDTEVVSYNGQPDNLQVVSVENKNISFDNVSFEDNIHLNISNCKKINLSNCKFELVLEGKCESVNINSLNKIDFYHAEIKKLFIEKCAEVFHFDCSIYEANILASDFSYNQGCVIDKLSVLAPKFLAGKSKINNSKILCDSVDLKKCKLINCNISGKNNNYIEECEFFDSQLSFHKNEKIKKSKFHNCTATFVGDESIDIINDLVFENSKISCGFDMFIYIVSTEKDNFVNIEHFKINSNSIWLNDSSGIFENPFKQFVYIDSDAQYYIFTIDSNNDVININNEFIDFTDKKLFIANPQNYPKEVSALLEDYRLITYNPLVFQS